MHYGHPDVFDRIFHISRGGISKASRVINISEDIYAGMPKFVLIIVRSKKSLCLLSSIQTQIESASLVLFVILFHFSFSALRFCHITLEMVAGIFKLPE